MPDPFSPETTPDPEGGWSEEIRIVKDAVIVPPSISALVQPTGVLESDGSYCAHGASWRKSRPVTTQPDPPEKISRVRRGRWLWGGVIWVHFGHFLVESSSRLWALDQLEEPIDGILFVPKRPRLSTRLNGYQSDFISFMAPGVPIKIAGKPNRVEELIVPGQGFGIGAITKGTPAFRRAIHNRFAKGIEPDGPRKLYISRSALGQKKGGLLGEERLESYLREEGYEIFHPQEHPMSVQIARYKAARQVIGADGSALHLFSMVGRPDQQVAIISRRKSAAQGYLIENIRHFCDLEPHLVQELKRQWVRADSEKSAPNRSSHGELNLEGIGKSLAAAGFISPQAEWDNLTDAELQKIFEDRRYTGNRALRAIEPRGPTKQQIMRRARRAAAARRKEISPAD